MELNCLQFPLLAIRLNTTDKRLRLLYANDFSATLWLGSRLSARLKPLFTAGKRGTNTQHWRVPAKKAENKEENLTLRLPAKCRALLIKSNVIQFHYTRPQNVCETHLHIKLAASCMSWVVSCLLSPVQLPPSPLQHSHTQTLLPHTLSLPMLCHLYLFYIPACSALQMWPTSEVTTKVN